MSIASFCAFLCTSDCLTCSSACLIWSVGSCAFFCASAWAAFCLLDWVSCLPASDTSLDKLSSISSGNSASGGGNSAPTRSSISLRYLNPRCSAICACSDAMICFACGFCPIICITIGSCINDICVAICASWSWYIKAFIGLPFNAAIFSLIGSVGFKSSFVGTSLSAFFTPKTSIICLCNWGKSYICGADWDIWRTAWYCTTLCAIVELFGSDTGITSIII